MGNGMRAASRRTTGCVLLPTDFQRPARRAFAYAMKLATVLGSRLEIIHVIKTVSESSQRAPDSRYLNSLKTSALLELGRMASTAKEAGIHADPSLRFGSPPDCILEVATRLHAGLIVMGTEGRTGRDRLRLGSTAQTVFSQAPCPVLAVHGGLAGDVARPPARVKLTRLLAATDFSPCAAQSLRVVSALARLTQAKVCVVHAADEGLAKEIGQRKLTALTRGLQWTGIDLESLSVPGDPVEIILRQAAHWHADIISVGTQGRRGLSRLLLGSVAEGVLRRAGCPVLVVKNAAPLVHAGTRHRQKYTSR